MAHAKTLSDTNFRALIALLEKESRDLARDRAMVLLSMKAGLRAIEIAGLTWGCIIGWAATHRTPAAAPLRRKRRGRRRPSAARSAMFKTCSGTPA